MENSDKGAEARSYCSIGNCLRAMIQPDKALECYNRVSHNKNNVAAPFFTTHI